MRLIDADALMTEFMDSDLDHLQRDDWREVIQIVVDAPTIQPEPCEDAVSRKTILKFLDDWMSVLEDNVHNQSVSDLKIIKKDFENLPLVQPEPHWIQVTERQPEKNGDYLCQEKLGFLYVDTWNGEYWDCAKSAYGTVIAWMPLPEPYKGATE